MRKKDKKKKHSRETQSKEKKGIISLIILTIILIIPALLFIFFAKFDLACMICSYVFIFIPLGMGYIIANAKKSGKYTDEQLKSGNIKAALLILYYWLIDLVILFIIENWFWPSIIFGGITIIINLCDLGNTLVNLSFNNKLFTFSMIFELISSISLTAYLIYIIPNEGFKNVLVPIIAATIGGLITLTGVYLTIKKTDRDKKEEELQKAKPVIFAIDVDSRFDSGTPKLKILLHSDETKDGLERASDEESAYTIPKITIFNSDMSNVVFYGIKINDIIHLYDSPQIIHKDSYVILIDDIRFKLEEDIDHISLLFKDILSNEYELETSFNIVEYGMDKEIKITEIKTIKMSTFSKSSII